MILLANIVLYAAAGFGGGITGNSSGEKKHVSDYMGKDSKDREKSEECGEAEKEKSGGKDRNKNVSLERGNSESGEESVLGPEEEENKDKETFWGKVKRFLGLKKSPK
ncbi:MAG TPA: hypothetical protein ENN55_05905 [Firmicutes bacterium]|nr:hypothetical protein [Bacillota bacterium]